MRPTITFIMRDDITGKETELFVVSDEAKHAMSPEAYNRFLVDNFRKVFEPMGTYNLNTDEIADVFEKLEIESHLEGDFSERDFVAAAKLYVERLRLEGAHIPK